ADTRYLLPVEVRVRLDCPASRRLRVDLDGTTRSRARSSTPSKQTRDDQQGHHAFAQVHLAAPSDTRTTSCEGLGSHTAPACTSAIRPFRVNVPEAELTELRRRIAATRWPEKETVSDTSQGVPLAALQDLARYWATDYDWRRCEARLNALPQFTTEIDGLDIHFIHVRSKHKGALPVIVTHGWPGSILEQIKLVGPLTDPTAFGGRAEDAFDVVIPSIPS